MAFSCSRLSGSGKTTVLKRRVRALESSLMPRSRLFEVAMTLKPFLACTSAPQLVDGQGLLTTCRMPSSRLSEKTLAHPRAGRRGAGQEGLQRHRHLATTATEASNELSSALTRRFNTVVLPLPESLEQEEAIVAKRVAELGRALELPRRSRPQKKFAACHHLRELRAGMTLDGAPS